MPNRHLPFRTLAAVAFAMATLSSVAIGQSAEGRVHGVVADESGGVLPGVTVAATAANGTVLAAEVTNDVGRYAFALPAAPVALTFSLEGFSPAKVDASPESLGTVLSQSSTYEHEHDNSLFAKNDQIVVDGGTQNGLAVGQNVVARRSYHPTPDMRSAIGEHTAGVLQIVSASD